MGPRPGPEPRAVADAYRGQVIVFGTRHGKERQAAPAFAAILDARVVAPPDLDTDRFGTFTGDVPRTLTPRDAARAKARLAMTATGSPYGLASEASYGPLPGLGWPGHDELLLFVDDTRGIEILEAHRTLDVPGPGIRVTRPAGIAATLARYGWPRQAMTVRPATGGSPDDTVKGITDPDHLAAAITTAVARSCDGHALVAPDLRAHHNPTRQAVLTRLAARLATRLATACPACGCPGHGRTAVERGLPCADCGAPTERIRADVHGCARCPDRQVRPRPDTTADPRWCPECNP